jgi:hypothetical protein
MTGVSALEVATTSLRLHLSVLPAVSRSSQRRGSRRILLTVDAAGLQGRLDDVATANEVDDLERSLQAWSTGVDATLVLPGQRVLVLSRRDGRVHATLVLGHDPDAATLHFRVPAGAVVVRAP